MRAILLTIILWACTLCGMQAQTIKKGDKFFDGMSLYTVQEVRMGKIVYMTSNEDNELTLEKVDGKEGEYTLQPSRQADEPPFGSKWGGRVQYIHQGERKLLAFRKPSNGEVVWTMDLTRNSYDNCVLMQQMMQQEEPENAGTLVLNRPYLDGISKADLRLMRNRILANHGYRFTSKDLQEHFGKYRWYKPVDDNSTIKLNIIEQVNLELIKSEEAER
ncbi:MAG: YARHG domain-containing protein [Bacteroidaceae bacterium]|nr:YARHG domain-containing protein [Bacteroidaceae bacterium]